MQKFARFMELFWLVLAVATAGWAVYVITTQGWVAGQFWLWFPLVCAAMWAYRRFTRRKMAEWEARQHGSDPPRH
ncbi:MAG: hypothetical protein JST66_02095 [Bacteroidetes bacterium]|nr:hypothetical protein [Bacteroidota bacterium]